MKHFYEDFEFLRYCVRNGITSKDYMLDVYQFWAAGRDSYKRKLYKKLYSNLTAIPPDKKEP